MCLRRQMNCGWRNSTVCACSWGASFITETVLFQNRQWHLHLYDLFDDSLWGHAGHATSVDVFQRNFDWFLLQVTLGLHSSFDFSVNHLGVVLLLVLGPELMLNAASGSIWISLYCVMQSSCCLCGAFSALLRNWGIDGPRHCTEAVGTSHRFSVPSESPFFPAVVALLSLMSSWVNPICHHGHVY